MLGVLAQLSKLMPLEDYVVAAYILRPARLLQFPTARRKYRIFRMIRPHAPLGTAPRLKLQGVRLESNPCYVGCYYDSH